MELPNDTDTILSELPSNLVLKKMSPRIWLPLLTALWGTLTMCLGFVTSFGSFVAVRALLGVAEGGLLPGMVLITRLHTFLSLLKPAGTISFAFLSAHRTCPPYRNLLYRRFSLGCFRWIACSRPQRDWPSRKFGRLALDFDHRGSHHGGHWRIELLWSSQLHRDCVVLDPRAESACASTSGRGKQRP